MNTWKSIFDEQRDLKDRIYYITLIVGGLALLLSSVTDYIQGFPIHVVLSLLFSFFIIVILFICSVRFHIEKIGMHILIYLFTLVILPELFLSSGGVTSGMLLASLLIIAITGVLLSGLSRIIAFTVGLLTMEFTIYYSYMDVEYVKELSYRDSVIDYGVTLFIVGLATIYIISAIIKAYEREQQKAMQLNKKLLELSVKDELSGLYNRRELFRRLDSIYQNKMGSKVPSSRKDCYIAMFDIDNFKSLNDTYGHQFGDEVLASVAGILMDHITEENGELASRYGGEEFMVVFRSADKETALKRVEDMRSGIENRRWEKNPALIVTVSGGLVGCEQYEELNTAIHKADELLYKAKHEGKNRIETDL